MRDSIALLKQIINLEMLDENIIGVLKEKVLTKQYRKGQIIMNSRSVFMVSRGSVKISRITETGDVVFKTIANQGDVFGGFFLAETSEEARVISDSVIVLRLRTDDVIPILKNHFAFTRYIGRLENNISQMENYYYALLTNDVKKRLIMFLERLAQNEGKDQNGTIVVESLLSTKDIAQSIFTSRQSVSWHLNNFERTGWIRRTGREIVFNGPAFERFNEIQTVNA